MTLKALIVDDEALARRGLEIRLRDYSDIEVCAQSCNGREAIAAVREHKPDVMFLDVQMPGMDGFDVIRQLSGERMPVTIFVTAYDQFALTAFETSALDYLLKPINDERLAAAVSRARDAVEAKKAGGNCSELLKFVCELSGAEMTLDEALEAAGSDTTRYPQRLAIRDGAHTACIDVGDIDWVDAAGDYMCVHVSGETHVLRGTMKRLEALLNPSTFVRIHRSAIVNRHRVTAMRPHRNGEYFLTLSGHKELKLSRKYKTNLDRIAHRSSC